MPKGRVLQALYTVRSDRPLCARMQTDLMFRWFVDAGLWICRLAKRVFDALARGRDQTRPLGVKRSESPILTIAEAAQPAYVLPAV